MDNYDVRDLRNRIAELEAQLAKTQEAPAQAGGKAVSDPMENWLMKPALEWLEQCEHGEDNERCNGIAAMLRDLWREHLSTERGEAERVAAWWALVMGAAAAVEDAAHCLRDPDAKRAAEGAAAHYRAAAKALCLRIDAQKERT